MIYNIANLNRPTNVVNLKITKQQTSGQFMISNNSLNIYYDGITSDYDDIAMCIAKLLDKRFTKLPNNDDMFKSTASKSWSSSNNEMVYIWNM